MIITPFNLWLPALLPTLPSVPERSRCPYLISVGKDFRRSSGSFPIQLILMDLDCGNCSKDALHFRIVNGGTAGSNKALPRRFYDKKGEKAICVSIPRGHARGARNSGPGYPRKSA